MGEMGILAFLWLRHPSLDVSSGLACLDQGDCDLGYPSSEIVLPSYQPCDTYLPHTYHETIRNHHSINQKAWGKALNGMEGI